jgi:hypothetical protein
MYDLHSLGWNSFQDLCVTVTREILGQAVQSFLPSRDGGRDGAFSGTWKRQGAEDLKGRFVIQCKFTGKSDYVIKVADLSDEVEKVKRLVRKKRCDIYVLITNAGVSGTGEEEIETLFKNAGAKHVLTLGADWLSQQIRENKRLRMSVPRIYGLGDLSQILDERAYSQARAILETMNEDLAKVVVTDAYRRAAEALDKRSFVLLVGEPAAGKTTIASMLAMAAIDQWGASTLKLDDPAKVVDRWNPEEPSQFFWIDDAFGVTQYEDFLVRGWNHVFPHVKSMLHKGAKIVMTSRDYIYNRARKDLKESAFPLLKEAKVVIDVHNLTIRERQQILYNHLKLGKQPRGFRSEIKPHLEMVAGHGRFIPETARRLSDPVFTKDLFIDPYYLGQFVEKREEFLQEVLNGLDRDSKAALALIYMRNDRLESPIELQPSETEALQRLGSTLGGCVAALEALTGSLVLLTQTGGDAVWRFKHPTVGDAFASILVHSPELLGIYIQGSAPEKLVTQVTCGDVGIEKAVVIPRVLFPLMLERLSEFPKSRNYKSPFLSTWGGKWALHSFLARRCSKEFLEMYLKANPGVLDQIVKPGLMLSAMAEVGLVVTLHKLGILPEEHRRQFIETVSQYAVDGDDLTAMNNKSIRTVFKDQEFDKLKERVRSELLPRLEEVRRNVELNHRLDEPPEEHMSSLMEIFDTLALHFGEDSEAARVVERQRRYANEWIGDHTPDEPKRKPRTLGNLEKPEKPRSGRSVFDDIDDDASTDTPAGEPS